MLVYAQQVELLRLLTRLAEIYSAVSLSLPSTNSLDAARMLVMGCIACLSDAIIRVHAADAPSIVSVHISGRDPNTGGAFGINVHEHYAAESECSLYTCAELTTTRCQVLDYFHSLHTTVKKHHVIFDFSTNRAVGFGDMELVKNLCLATGFSHERSQAPELMTGERPQLLQRFPELACFRDIALHWSVLLTANRSDLPEQRAWTASDARLQWSARDEQYSVRAYNRQLVATQANEKSEGILGRLYNAFASSTKRVASAADPSVLLGIENSSVTEEDVLYIRHLPELAGLPASSVELLLQYLTAPFLRIPLVLHFFSDQVRFRALSSQQLQAIVDAVLFEPGPFRQAGKLVVPAAVPAPRDFLGTPCGLLVNELQRSPAFILRTIVDMAEELLDMDEGRARGSSAAYVMYAVRLLARVHSYLRTVGRHQQWVALSGDKKSGCLGAAAVRGLALVDPQHLDALVHASDSIKRVLLEKAHDTLTAWLHRLPTTELRTACDIWSHLMLIHGTVHEPQQLSEESIRMLLTGQVFLSANSTDTDEGWPAEDLVPRDELADIFCKVRGPIHSWLATAGSRADAVCETVLAIVAERKRSAADGATVAVDRHWIMGKGDYAAQFAPETELQQQEASHSSFEAFLRSQMTRADTVVDIGLGTLKIKQAALQCLPIRFAKMDEISVVPNIAAGVQAAPIALTEHREWLRLVGLRYDVSRWTADPRPLTPQLFGFRLRFPDRLKAKDAWVKSILDHFLSSYTDLSSTRLFMQKEQISSAISNGRKSKRLIGYLSEEEEGEEAAVHEIVVFRNPPSVSVSRLESYGRRIRAVPEFFAPASLSLHVMPPSHCFPHGDRGSSVECCGGIDKSPPESVAQLVVTRTISKSLGEQTFVPVRFLHGLLPDALVEQYAPFWQCENGALLGYKGTASEGMSILRVSVNRYGAADRSGFDTSLADAVVQRMHVHADYRGSLPGMDDVDSERPVETLINLQQAPGGSKIAVLSKFFCRLESVSHLLVWAEPERDSDALCVSRVELPRLRLSFRRAAKTDIFLCDQFPGFQISNQRTARLQQDILRGAGSSAILLESSGREVAILVPAGSKPVAVLHPKSSAVVMIGLDRSDSSWLGNLGEARAYLYRVHASESYVVPSTVEASLYMLLQCFLTRSYTRVPACIASCITDVQLSAEAEQITQCFRLFSNNKHPDAIACRLKLMLAFECTPIRLPWSLVSEVERYACVRLHVSAACRLSLSEEHDLLMRASESSELSDNAHNRMRYLDELSEAETGQRLIEVDVAYPPVPTGTQHFDQVETRKGIPIGGLADAVGVVRYTRPYRPDVENSIRGAPH